MTDKPRWPSLRHRYDKRFGREPERLVRVQVFSVPLNVLPGRRPEEHVLARATERPLVGWRVGHCHVSAAVSVARLDDSARVGQAFAAARKDLGPGKTFQWTDDAGVTRTYTTDTKEEAGFKTAVNQATGDFDSRDVSLVKGRLTEAIRMSNITGRFDDSNPAALTEKEMSSFIDN